MACLFGSRIPGCVGAQEAWRVFPRTGSVAHSPTAQTQRSTLNASGLQQSHHYELPILETAVEIDHTVNRVYSIDALLQRLVTGALWLTPHSAPREELDASRGADSSR